MQKKGDLSAEEIRKRIRQGNEQRRKERVERLTDELEEKEEREEEEKMRNVTTTQYLGNVLIALLFMSLPLSDPEVDWIQVAVFAATNFIWNYFFHRSSWVHLIFIFALNFFLVQWLPMMYHIPQQLAKVSPVLVGGVVFVNVAFGAGMWVFYVNKKSKKKEREEACDVLALTVIAVNLLVLVVSAGTASDAAGAGVPGPH